MEAEGLLASKSAGWGEQKFWAFADTKDARSLDLKHPGWLHPLLHDHERCLGDVFVALMLSGELREWNREETKNLKEDAQFCFGPYDDSYFLEVEMGNHGESRITEKINRYRKHYAATGEAFRVLFVVQTEGDKDKTVALFDSLQLSTHYSVCLFTEIAVDPLTTNLYHRKGQKLFV